MRTTLLSTHPDALRIVEEFMKLNEEVWTIVAMQEVPVQKEVLPPHARAHRRRGAGGESVTPI